MTFVAWFAATAAAGGCLLWIALHLASIRALRAIPNLSAAVAPEPAAWPRLSVIIPACNEAATLESALATLLAQDYPSLEILLVDDRSTDGTGAIVDRLAQTDARIKPLHVSALPEGWLGKVHAMHMGVNQATGDWLLFTDADVHFAPGALRRAIAAAVQQKLGYFAILPRIITRSFLLSAAVNAFGTYFLTGVKPWYIGKPGHGAFAGVGAFNLVSRPALERTPGLEWLRLEVADDNGLAFMLYLADTPAAFMYGGDWLSIEWYESVPAIIKGLEKNGFAVAGQYQIGRTAAILAAGACVVVGPLAAFWVPNAGWLTALGVAAWGTLALAAWQYVAILGRDFGGAMAAPIGHAIFFYAIFQSARAAVSQGGIKWRGTLYPLDVLRRGQRLKF